MEAAWPDSRRRRELRKIIPRCAPACARSILRTLHFGTLLRARSGPRSGGCPGPRSVPERSQSSGSSALRIFLRTLHFGTLLRARSGLRSSGCPGPRSGPRAQPVEWLQRVEDFPADTLLRHAAAGAERPAVQRLPRTALGPRAQPVEWLQRVEDFPADTPLRHVAAGAERPAVRRLPRTALRSPSAAGRAAPAC